MQGETLPDIHLAYRVHVVVTNFLQAGILFTIIERSGRDLVKFYFIKKIVLSLFDLWIDLVD